MTLFVSVAIQIGLALVIVCSAIFAFAWHHWRLVPIAVGIAAIGYAWLAFGFIFAAYLIVIVVLYAILWWTMTRYAAIHWLHWVLTSIWIGWIVGGIIIILLVAYLPIHKTTDGPIIPIVTVPVVDTTVTINGCLNESAGKMPDGTPLKFAVNPSSGVLCEYEFFSQDKNVKVVIPKGEASLVADWNMTCATGPACEGTWVARPGTSFILPAGWLIHMYVYASEFTAYGRFPSFACDYLRYGNKDHTNSNIRVPVWASDSGTILSVPACPGFAGEPGK